jgi:hypothetical protein
MSWRQDLEVTSGALRVVPAEHPATHAVEAVMKCREPLFEGDQKFLVGIRKVDHPIRLPSPEQRGPFKVLGVTIELGPSIPRTGGYGAQPSNFLHLCKRLLRPRRDKGEEAYGYRVSAYLNLVEAETETITITADLHPHSFIELAHLREPYVILAHHEQMSAPSPDRVIEEFGHRWWRLAK